MDVMNFANSIILATTDTTIDVNPMFKGIDGIWYRYVLSKDDGLSKGLDILTTPVRPILNWLFEKLNLTAEVSADKFMIYTLMYLGAFIVLAAIISIGYFVVRIYNDISIRKYLRRREKEEKEKKEPLKVESREYNYLVKNITEDIVNNRLLRVDKYLDYEMKRNLSANYARDKKIGCVDSFSRIKRK